MLNRISAKILILTLAALGLALSLAAPAAAQNWQRVTHASGGFTAQFPGYTSEISQPAQTADGAAILHVVSYETKGGRELFAIAYNDCPSAADLSNVEQVLNRTRDGQLSGNARVTSQRATSTDGRPGKYFVAKANDGTLIASRIFLDGRRLYQVTYENRDGQMPEAAATFLNSFRITR